MTHIDISLPNHVVEKSIDTPSFFLVYQDGETLKTVGDFQLIALAPLLAKVDLQKILPMVMQLLSMVQKKKA